MLRRVTFDAFPFSIDAERRAWTTAARAGFLMALEGGAVVVPDVAVEWTVVPPRVVTDTVVEEVLMTDDVTEIDTVEVVVVFPSLAVDTITFEVFVFWPSSFSHSVLVVTFWAVESSVDGCVVTSPEGNGVLIAVTMAETWELLGTAEAAPAVVVTGVDVGGVEVSVEPPPFDSRSFCAAGWIKTHSKYALFLEIILYVLNLPYLFV